MTTVALVAAKDAAATIDATVRALATLRGVDEVWVVDDGSTDATADAAHEAGAHVVRLDANVGKGGALAAGAAATPHADRYLLADADVGSTATGLQPLLDGSHHADLVVGVLPSAEGRGGFGLVKRFAASGIRRACGVRVRAPLSGQRVIAGDALRSLSLAGRFGVEVGMTIDVARRGGVVEERPVVVDHHHTGRSWKGFVHRGRQGRDIAAALLPRITSSTQRVVAVVIAAAVVFAALSGASRASAPPRGEPLGRAKHVVLFAYRGLTLRDLDRGDLPALRSVRARGATGALSVRTSDRRSLDRHSNSDAPSLLDAYASLGASARVRAVASFGTNSVPGRVAHMAQARRLSRHDRAASPPGALGDALHRAGQTTGVFGAPEAAVALADQHGIVDIADPDPGASAAAFDHVSVAFVDPGALPLTAIDAVLRGVVDSTAPDATVMVFAPTPRGADWELTPIVISGRGVRRGTIASSSTRRASLGVLSDLAPTVLSVLGAPSPNAMTGTALHTTPQTFHPGALERLEVDGAARARFFLGAAVAYTVLAIIFYLGFIAAMTLGSPKRVLAAFRTGVCVAAAFPFALLVTGALQHWAQRGGESPAVLMVTTTAIGVVVSRSRGLRPVYTLAALTVAVIVVDVAVTGPIHAASLLGYTIQTTGRFYGLPNASFSVYAASLFLVAAAVAGTGNAVARATAGVAVLGVGTLFLAAPWLGNDVGGTLAMTPIVLLCAWSFYGRAITARVLIASGAAAAAALAALVAAEALFGSGTHLGRAASRGVADNGSLRNTLLHRADANFGLLVDQWWGFLCIVLALGGLYALVVQRRWLAFLPARSPQRAATVAVLAVSLLGFLANDSGPVVIVLCLVVLAPAMALVALDGPAKPPA